MVRLDRIYTRTGDDGSTGLGDGQRLPKHHLRIAAYGTTDELSSLLGLILAEGIKEPWFAWLRSIQNDLFDVGADLCVPTEDENSLRVTKAYTSSLEEQIDEINSSLKPLQSFICPEEIRPRRGCTSRERSVVEQSASSQSSTLCPQKRQPER